MALDGRNKYTLLKEASQVLDRYEMKLTFDEEGVSDPNGNCVVPKISAKFLKAAQKEAFRCYLSQKKLHGVFFKQRDGIQNSPIPGCQMVETGGLVVAAKDSLGPIRSEFSSNAAMCAVLGRRR